MVGPTPTIKVRVKYGIFDALTGLLTETGVIYDGDPAGMPVVGVFSVPGGALMQIIPRDGGSFTVPATIKFTPDGVGFVTLGTMPFAPYRTGLITGVDKKTVVCPMYDGDHSLYETKDWGATWTKRATIYEGAPAPTPGNPVLQRFGQLTYLRKDDIPVIQTPATPWATDCKYPAPP
jgi:hypothetical protein